MAIITLSGLAVVNHPAVGPLWVAVGRAGRPAATLVSATCIPPVALTPSTAYSSKTHITFWLRSGPVGS